LRIAGVDISIPLHLGSDVTANLRQSSCPPFRTPAADRGCQRELEEHDALESRSRISHLEQGAPLCWRHSTSSMPRFPTSTTSTRRVYLANHTVNVNRIRYLHGMVSSRSCRRLIFSALRLPRTHWTMSATGWFR
jgi:hypothetical protein